MPAAAWKQLEIGCGDFSGKNWNRILLFTQVPRAKHSQIRNEAVQAESCRDPAPQSYNFAKRMQIFTEIYRNAEVCRSSKAGGRLFTILSLSTANASSSDDFSRFSGRFYRWIGENYPYCQVFLPAAIKNYRNPGENPLGSDDFPKTSSSGPWGRPPLTSPHLWKHWKIALILKKLQN